MKRGLKKGTTGFRPRRDQAEAIERLMESDPELNMSIAIRRGLDLFIVERTSAMMGTKVYRNIEAVRVRDVLATDSTHSGDTDRTRKNRRAGAKLQS